MTPGRTSDARQRTGPARTSPDVVVVGDGDLAALHTMRALGLRVVRAGGAREARSVLRATIRPAVVLIRPSARAGAQDLGRLRLARPDLRTILVTTDPDVARPAGIDEALRHDVPDDELVGRVVIHLAHARAAAPRRLQVADDTVLDLDARALRRRGRLIRLRPVESRLLEELARSPGRPLSRDWLMERAWPSPPPAGSRTIDVHVRWLRQKLEADPRRPVHLLTIRGVGYQLEPDPEPDGQPAA